MLTRFRTKQASAIATASTTTCTKRRSNATASAAAADQPAAVSVIGTSRSGGSDPLLQFYDDFDVSEKNYHTLLLDEAHLKHLVHKNVPPQDPPKIDPPNVPAPIYCADLKEFLAVTKLEYSATHDPPPLRTTGVGNVLLDAVPVTQDAAAVPAPEKKATTAAAAKKDATGAGATAATGGEEDPLVEVLMNVEEEVTIEVEVEDEEATKAAAEEAKKQAEAEEEARKKAEADTSNVKRAPVENDKKFHCTLCGKPFRLKLAAQHHLTAKHPEGGAEVAEGPGPGEIIEAGAAATSAPKTVAAPRIRKKKIKKTVKKLVERRFTKRLSEVEGVPGVKILKKGNEGQGKKKGSLTPVEAEPPKAAETKKDPNRPPEVVLPSEEEIRILLEDVWDVYGKQTLQDSYKSAQAVVIATADKRKPVDPDAPVKEAVAATPAYARKPEKKPMTTLRPDKVVNINVLSARFPNPFGDSASYMGDEDEEQASANPFLAANAIKKPKPEKPAEPVAEGEEAPKEEPPVVATPETSTLPMPSLHAAALKRQFKCSLCDASFRLLDALQNHYNKKHGMEMPAEELRKAKLMKKRGSKYGVEEQKKNQEDAAASAQQESDKAKTDGAAEGDKANADKSGDKKGPDATSPILASEVGVHIRSVSNIVLMGTVREVKEGFVKADPVVQLLLSVADSTDADAPPELITVRVFGGDQVKNMTRDAKTGAEVLVNGILKLNRRIDAESKRTHSYPYIQVTYPHGSLVVMEHSWTKAAAGAV